MAPVFGANTNSLMRLPSDWAPWANVGPDSVTNAWSSLAGGKPLPLKVAVWMKAMFTGPWAGYQALTRGVAVTPSRLKLAMLASEPVYR